jgi:ABC-type antimicrobial peptide transport system permease subunit
MTKNLKETATGFTIITAFIIICVTIVTTIILLNSRKYEMAVLRSVGMKKSRLILNYLIENLIFIWSITAISLTAAQFIGPIFTNRVFEGMQSLISTEMFETLTSGANFELLLQNIVFVFGGMTVIVVLSLTLACINIIRFEPMKIFNKQY